MTVGSLNINHSAQSISALGKSLAQGLTSSSHEMETFIQEITQYEGMSQATRFISFKTPVHSNVCAGTQK